jgi:hypothetical protein
LRENCGPLRPSCSSMPGHTCIRKRDRSRDRSRIRTAPLMRRGAPATFGV